MSDNTLGTNLYGDSINGVSVALTEENGYIMMAKGDVVPVNASTGYAKGCLFIQTDGGVGTTLYVNQGTAASSAFAALDTSTGGLPALTNNRVWLGNGSNVATAVALSGDITTANTGVATIANDAITTVKILNANVTLAKLASGITPSHIVKFAAQHTTVGGAAAEAITVTGALNTDLAFIQLVNDGTNNVSVLSAVVTADTLTVTFSADPGNDAVINYQLLRAVS